MTELPFVSVVIPVWNAPAQIDACLRAMATQTYPKDRFEVIVVDNGSTDATPEVVAGFAWAILLSEPVAGSYRARNRGLRHARGDYVAFTDADCVPDPGWLAGAMRAAGRLPEAGVLAGRIELFRISGRSQDVCEHYERLFAFNQEANVRSGMCVTANWVSPRPLLVELGGFDDRLKSGGDADCARRIRAAGRQIVYVPDMPVGHPVRASVGELVQKRRRIIGGRMMAERRKRRPLSWLWTYVLISGAQARRALHARQYKLADRLWLAGLIGWLGIVSALEILRIAGGGEPRRA